ncbi:hypothetical protein B0H13DRAFT_2372300 [Mycena leptocephala]|nr:hypothetical protein B0H13DRAFT_2372300 [Mycena leptocephala]
MSANARMIPHGPTSSVSPNTDRAALSPLSRLAVAATTNGKAPAQQRRRGHGHKLPKPALAAQGAVFAQRCRFRTPPGSAFTCVGTLYGAEGWGGVYFANEYTLRVHWAACLSLLVPFPQAWAGRAAARAMGEKIALCGVSTGPFGYLLYNMYATAGQSATQTGQASDKARYITPPGSGPRVAITEPIAGSSQSVPTTQTTAMAAPSPSRRKRNLDDPVPSADPSSMPKRKRVRR